MKKFFPSRLILKLSKISMQPNNIKNNFANTNSRRKFHNSLNLVFVKKKQDQKDYENQKIEKIVRKQKSKLAIARKKTLFNRRAQKNSK